MFRRSFSPALWATVFAAACGGTSAPSTGPTPGAGPTVVEVSLPEVGLEATTLDRSADPCTDFYQFACGGWLAANQIPADRAVWGRFSELGDRNQEQLKTLIEAAAKKPADPVEQKFGDYYAACVDEAAIEARGLDGAKPLLDAIAKVRDVGTLGAAVTALHQHGVSALFEVMAEADFLDSKTAILFVDTGGLGLPDRDYYLDADKAKLREAYQAHVAAVLTLTGKGKAAATLAKDVVALETALAQITKPAAERRDPVAMYNPSSVEALAKAAPAFAWPSYFAALGNPTPGKLAVTTPAYFGLAAPVDDTVDRKRAPTPTLPALLKSTKPATWQAYLTVRVIDELALALPKRFDEETFKLTAAVSGATEQRPRWKRCIDATAAAMPELIGQPYVAKYFPGTSKETAQKLIAAVADVMNAQMGALPWMTEATRAAARAKLAKLEPMIGYPDTWRVYDFAVDRGDFAASYLAANAFEVRRQYAKGGKPYDRSEWLMPPFIVNAYYNPNANNTALPAGILQPPFFGKDRSIAANLGGIGMVIGHELTHGFDDQGAQFDADGKPQGLVAGRDKTQFKERGQCLAKQYSTFEGLPGRTIDGQLTLGENIADVGGIKHAFLAYRKLRAGADKTYRAEGLTEDQQFFVAVGQAWCSKYRDEEAERRLKTDPHSPPKWRVNGALRNLPQFAEAFGCKAGAAMAPTDRCEIW
jgi:putative endopeptidase